MATNLDKHRSDLDSVVALADKMLSDLHFRYLREQKQLDKAQHEKAKQLEGCFESDYQGWFTEAIAIVRQLIPDRVAEFDHLYKGDGKRKAVNESTYNIQDWLNGVRSGVSSYTGKKAFDDFASVTMRFTTQAQILKSATRRFESSLFDIRQLVQADLLDSELKAARELMNHGFLRAAGAVAGVVLEKHLGQVAINHGLEVRKKNPAIGDLNDLLKKNDVLDVPVWRQIQRLADTRNICDHKGTREPRTDEIDELIAGVDKITGTLF